MEWHGASIMAENQWVFPGVTDPTYKILDPEPTGPLFVRNLHSNQSPTGPTENYSLPVRCSQIWYFCLAVTHGPTRVTCSWKLQKWRFPMKAAKMTISEQDSPLAFPFQRLHLWHLCLIFTDTKDVSGETSGQSQMMIFSWQGLVELGVFTWIPS